MSFQAILMIKPAFDTIPSLVIQPWELPLAQTIKSSKIDQALNMLMFGQG